MKYFTVILFSFFSCNSSFAFREFYSLSKSIRSLGMGGVFYTLSDDEYGLFYNPAGLSQIRRDGELMLNWNSQFGTGTFSALKSLSSVSGSISNAINQLQSFQGQPIYFQTGLFPYYATKNFAVGLLIADTKGQLGIMGKDVDTYVDINVISDSGLVVGYARTFEQDWHVGLNVKGLLKAGGKKNLSVLEIAQNQGVSFNPADIGGVGFGIDFDLGAIYDVPELPWGVLNQVSLTINNMLASQMNLVRIQGTPPGLSRMVTLGFRSVFPGVWHFDNFHVMLDLSEFGLGGESDPNYGARIGSFWKHVNLGVEAPVMGWIFLRTGIHQGNLTAGIGIYTQALKFDFAYYAEEIAYGVGRISSPRLAFRLALGMGSTAPAPIFAKDAIPAAEKTDPAQAPAEAPKPEPAATEPVNKTENGNEEGK